MENWLC